MKILIAAIAMLLCALCIVPPALAAPAVTARDLPPGLQIPDAARPGPSFDVDRATQAYLDLLSAGQRASSRSVQPLSCSA